MGPPPLDYRHQALLSELGAVSWRGADVGSNPSSVSQTRCCHHHRAQPRPLGNGVNIPWRVAAGPGAGAGAEQELSVWEPAPLPRRVAVRASPVCPLCL